LQVVLEQATVMPQPADVAVRFTVVRRRVRHLRAISDLLFDLAREPLPTSPALSPLDEAMLEGTATIVQTAATAAATGTSPERHVVMRITAEPGPARSQVRALLDGIGAGLAEADRARFAGRGSVRPSGPLDQRRRCSRRRNRRLRVTQRRHPRSPCSAQRGSPGRQ
jgi:hypothetical protein